MDLSSPGALTLPQTHLHIGIEVASWHQKTVYKICNDDTVTSHMPHNNVISENDEALLTRSKNLGAILNALPRRFSTCTQTLFSNGIYY